MDLRFERRLRPIAAVVLFFFTFYCIEPLNFAAYAQTPSMSASQNKSKSAEEEFQEAIEKIRNGIDQEDANKIKTGQGAVEKLDVKIRQQFRATENEIKNLPDVIKQRHKEFVKQYEENLKALKTNLDEIKKAKTKTEKEQANKKTKEFLEKTKSPSRHTPLDPNNLPHRTPKVKERKPRLNKEDFAELVGAPLAAPIQLAFAGSDQQLLALITPDPSLSQKPTPADLTETIEVQFTPEIMALAEQLGKNPVKIYNYVRNNIDFVPTYGSIQGANMCLMTKQCNDMDTASLLIALLRASGISSRYVIGTIEVPIDKVMNWVGGFTDAKAAGNFIASGGTPIKSFIEGGKIAKVQMEHAWVETYISYGNYRGTMRDQSEKTWIPLDASFKQFTFTPGIDLQTAVPFDAQAFANQLQSTATIDPVTGSVTNVNATFIQSTLTDLQTRLQAAFPNATVDQLVGKKTIIPHAFPFLPATLPYQKVVIGSKPSAVPESLRHKITFEVAANAFFGADLTYTASLPELSGKRISLRYSPATEADKTTLLSFKDATTVSAYLVKMKPELLVEGVVKATGESVTMGTDETFSMIFSEPGVSGEQINNVITAGSYTGIGLDLGVVSEAVVQKRVDNLNVTKSRFATGDLAAISLDDVIGESLTVQALGYFFELDLLTKIIKQQQGVIAARLPSEGLVTQEVRVRTLFGIPFSASAGGPSIDIDRDIEAVLAKDGDAAKVIQYFQASGPLGSGLEHGIFEQIYGGEGISAVKALSIANSQGIPIYQVTSANLNTVLPQLALSVSVKTDIANAVNAGKVVTVPQREISFNGWNGVGYTVIDPATGAGGYIISGGLAGGELLKLIINIMGSLLSPSEASAADVAGQQKQVTDQSVVKKVFCSLVAPTLTAVVFLALAVAIYQGPEVFAAMAGLGLLGAAFLLVFYVVILFVLLTFLEALIEGCFLATSRRYDHNGRFPLYA